MRYRYDSAHSTFTHAFRCVAFSTPQMKFIWIQHRCTSSLDTLHLTLKDNRHLRKDQNTLTALTDFHYGRIWRSLVCRQIRWLLLWCRIATLRRYSVKNLLLANKLSALCSTIFEHSRLGTGSYHCKPGARANIRKRLTGLRALNGFS